MNPEEHLAYVEERFMEGEWNEWEAFAELLIVATWIFNSLDRLAHIQYAAKTMGMWTRAKREILARSAPD